MKNLLLFVRKNFINVGISIIILLIAIAVFLTYYNKVVMIETTIKKQEAELVKQKTSSIFQNIISGMDLGIRGYAITKNEQLLQPFTGFKRNYSYIYPEIDSLLKKQNLDIPEFQQAKKATDEYVKTCETLLDYIRKDSLNLFLSLLNEDKGNTAWKEFDPFATKIYKVEDRISEKAQADYEAALNRNLIVQVILFFIGVPILLLVMFRMTRESNDRKGLLQELETNNRHYLFDPGSLISVENPREIVENSIQNFKKAADFIKNISSGNYEVQWEGMTPENAKLNDENLAGEMIKMREEMKKVKAVDEKRSWTNEGLAKFSEIVRNHQNNLETLSNESVRFLTKYLHAQQGSLFILNENESFLELSACYAFDKKKFVEKRIEIGSGLVGQAFLEKKTVLMTRLPQGYTSITSGLGDATPNALVIVPMQYNEKVGAILELAGFGTFEPYQIEFLERCGEFVASALVNARTTEKMQLLLEQSNEQTEEMKAQEEELRQNMEEMEATQEELHRKSRDLEVMLDSVSLKEKDLNESKRWLQIVIDNLPIAIFWKESKNLSYMGANKIFAEIAGFDTQAIIGKTDFDCPWTHDESEIYRADDFEVLKVKESKLNIEEKQTDNKGDVTWLRTSKIPILDERGNAVAVLGMFENINERKLQEQELKNSELWLQTIINHLPKGIFWKESKNLSFLGANKIFADLAGFTPKSIVGKTDYDCPWKKEESDIFRADDFEIIKNQQAKIDIEEQNTTADGKIQWMSTTKVPIANEQGEVIAVLGMFEDITLRKTRELDYEIKIQEIHELRIENETLRSKMLKVN